MKIYYIMSIKHDIPRKPYINYNGKTFTAYIPYTTQYYVDELTNPYRCSEHLNLSQHIITYTYHYYDNEFEIGITNESLNWICTCIKAIITALKKKDYIVHYYNSYDFYDMIEKPLTVEDIVIKSPDMDTEWKELLDEEIEN